MKEFKSWFIVSGILLVIIGVLFIFFPIESLLVFGKIVGIIMVVYAITRLYNDWEEENKFLNVIIVMVNLLFAIYLMLNTFATIIDLLLVYVIWLFITGIINLILQIKMNTFGLNLNTFNNFLSIIVGILVLTYSYLLIDLFIITPYVLAFYFLVIGISEIYIGSKEK